MASDAAALVVHDLKNALGALEARLHGLSLSPDAASAGAAWRDCRDLRQRLVAYLTVYGHDGPLRAHRDDESPAELLQALARRHVDEGQSVIVEAGPAMPPCWQFDRRLVQLALEAALHNALRFARRQVLLSARAEAGHLVFSVRDDGPGPLASGPTGPYATGLGNQLCRAVARAHDTSRADGGVRLLQRADAEGACFELWLAT